MAVVQHASTVRERRACTTLDGLVALVAAQGIGSPAILVVGRVVEAARFPVQAREAAVRKSLECRGGRRRVGPGPVARPGDPGRAAAG